MASVSGVKFRDIITSIACGSISMAVIAVILFGRVAVVSRLTTAASANSLELYIDSLTLSTISTDAGETSLPVPAVVGTKINGFPSSLTLFTPI
ncbi:MAG: hypothetical protein QW612_05910 [Candidatus Bathyarchaeia archaeon]